MPLYPPKKKFMIKRAPTVFVLGTWLATLGIIAFKWKHFASPSLPLNLATIATALYFGWKASLQGFAWEILSLIQLFGSIGIGFFATGFFSGLAGFTGIAGNLFGFYSGFLFAYLGSAIIFWLLRDLSQLPAIESRIFGFLLGAFEGTLLIGIVATSLAFIPQAEVSSGDKPAFAANLVEKAFEPLIPDSASGPIEMLKVAAEMKKGFDPEKVDREELRRQFTPIIQNARLQEVANDQELIALVHEKNIGALIKNPKIRVLLTDPEMLKLATQIDLHKVADTLRPGLVQRPVSGR